MDEIVIEIGMPKRVRHPAQSEPTVYSGKLMKKMVAVPVEDGYKVYPHHFNDTPSGWHEYQKTQAKLLDQEDPPHPLGKVQAELEEKWHIRVRIDGEDQIVKVPSDVLPRLKSVGFFLAFNTGCHALSRFGLTFC